MVPFLPIEIGDRQRDAFAALGRHNHDELARPRLVGDSRRLDNDFKDLGSQFALRNDFAHDLISQPDRTRGRCFAAIDLSELLCFESVSTSATSAGQACCSTCLGIHRPSTVWRFLLSSIIHRSTSAAGSDIYSDFNVELTRSGRMPLREILPVSIRRRDISMKRPYKGPLCWGLC